MPDASTEAIHRQRVVPRLANPVVASTGPGVGAATVSDKAVKWLIALAVVVVLAILVIVIGGVFSNTCPCTIN
jgi:hypothetical protein